jgi:hypothetical protein
MKKLVRRFVVLAVCFFFTTACVLAQSASADNQSTMSSSRHNSRAVGDNFGIGVKVGLLGVGAEIAARVNHHSNLRAGFNVLGYSRSFDKDGINYDGHLSFRTIEAHYDYFPWAGSFHISGGILDYMGNPITANAVVPGDTAFSLGGVQYYGSTVDPAKATGRVNFNQVSPTVTFGFGNLVRENKHFSFPIELGVAFQGSPKSILNLTGGVCSSPSSAPPQNCRTVASDPTVQSNVLAEQTKINNSMKPFKYYPIISFGFGYKF